MTATLEDPVPITDDDFGGDQDDFLDDPPLPDAPPVPAGGKPPPDMTIDRATGQLRPKKRPGRPRHPASADELRAAEPPPMPQEDAAPVQPPKRDRVRVDDESMPKNGIISKAVNKLYRRAGKIVRAMDHDIGTAVIECSQDGDPDSVGVAWEELARSDPAVRAWLMRVIKGGSIWDLVLAHAPIGIAIMLHPRLQFLLTGKRMGRVVEAFLEGDEDDPDGMAGMDQDVAEKIANRIGMDADQMADMAQEVAERMAGNRKLPQGVAPRRAPNGFREQPKNRTRAQRKASG